MNFEIEYRNIAGKTVMVVVEARSNQLFGRYYAMAVYNCVASLIKPEFTTGEVAALSGVSVGVVSKELARLVSMEVIESTSHRGDYKRIDDGDFWQAMDALGRWANSR